MVQTAIATRTVNFRKFKTYVGDRARNETRALSEIEENGVASAFERCRMLARLINTDLSRKNPEQVEVALLAELQVCLERAASVLNEQPRLRK
jgi:hypothetical protein